MLISKFTRAFISLMMVATGTIGFFSACQPQSTSNKPTVDATAQRYELNGKVVSVEKPAGKNVSNGKQAGKAKIEHDEIKGFMPAMTMDFPIKDEWVVRELEPNDKIAADLVVTKDSDYYLENVKIMKAPRDQNGKIDTETATGDNLIGVEIPDFKLINQNGKRFGLRDYQGKNVVVTFIFTRCPDANMCPLMSINFSDLEKELRKSTELASKTRLLSISFDPEYDTPEVLRKYAGAYQGKDAKPAFDIWNLATGSVQEVKDVEGFLGANSFKGEDNRLVHNLRTVIINADGKIVKVYAGNGWKSIDVLSFLKTL